MKLQVVLVNPVIPPNTGNIARLTAANRARLRLIEPLGFEISDSRLKRAGLDYWPEANVTVHQDWEGLLSTVTSESNRPVAERLWLFTTKAEVLYTEVRYQEDDILVFGNEEKGLPETLHSRYRDRRLRIPIDNPNVRSLNLANSVAIVFYEAKRQIGKDR